MEGENKYVETRDPFKNFLDEALTQHSNEIMDSFLQILQRLPTGDASLSNKGASPFKVQINFDISILEGHIDTNVVENG
jgi:hypothetical protein